MTEQETYKGYTITVSYDEFADDPTEWGNFTITHWRDHDGLEKAEDGATISAELQEKLDDGRAFFIDKYEHSAVKYSLMGELGGDTWDTSRGWGVIEFSDEYATNAPDIDGRREMARQDLETYTQWANGEVYHYSITDQHGDMIDSCAGYYGEDDAITDAHHFIDTYQPPRASVYALTASKLHA